MKDYYLTTRDKWGGFITYLSEGYLFKEDDLISLIKICIKEGRNKKIGNRILAIYIDSTQDRISETEALLNKIGIKTNGRTKIKTARK